MSILSTSVNKIVTKQLRWIFRILTNLTNYKVPFELPYVLQKTPTNTIEKQSVINLICLLNWLLFEKKIYLCPLFSKRRACVSNVMFYNSQYCRSGHILPPTIVFNSQPNFTSTLLWTQQHLSFFGQHHPRSTTNTCLLEQKITQGP